MTLLSLLRKDNFPSLFDNEFFGQPRDFFNPKANIVDREKNYLVELEIPGVKKDQVEITFRNDTLKIVGEKKNQSNEEDAYHYSFETSYGKFERSWLIKDVDDSKIDAKFDRGILSIILPKTQAGVAKKEIKTIPIK